MPVTRTAKLILALAGGFLLAPLPLAAQDAAPRVSMETSLGTIVFELDREHTPASVENFLRYAKRAISTAPCSTAWCPVSSSRPAVWMRPAKGRGVHEPIPLETANAQSNARGTITMAHGDEPDSATAEFFINLVDNKGLDRMPDDHDNKTGYAAFGRVIEGMDVVDSIAKVPLNGGYGPFGDAAPAMPVTIVKVTIQN